VIGTLESFSNSFNFSLSFFFSTLSNYSYSTSHYNLLTYPSPSSTLIIIFPSPIPHDLIGKLSSCSLSLIIIPASSCSSFCPLSPISRHLVGLQFLIAEALCLCFLLLLLHEAVDHLLDHALHFGKHIFTSQMNPSRAKLRSIRGSQISLSRKVETLSLSRKVEILS
jgi:hypothetical protein